MSLLKLTEENFTKEVLEDKGTVLVDFWAPWCGPCQVLGPIIEKLAEEVEGKAKIAKLNVDDNQQLAAKYEVRGIPTVIVFKNGEPKQRLVGVQPKEAYLEAIE
jgi:thioredoxin 1